MAPVPHGDDRWIARLTSEGAEREEAIEELRELLVRGLSRSLNHRYGGGFQAEDVVQEAIMKILDSLQQFEGRARFTTWAMTVATRVGISALRRKHFQDVSLDAITAEDSLRMELAVDPLPTPDSQFEHASVLATLRDLVDSVLSDRQKIAIRGQLEGIPIEEIARRTGSNRNAVYKLVHDARMKLRTGLEQAGVMAHDVEKLFA